MALLTPAAPVRRPRFHPLGVADVLQAGVGDQ